MDKVFKALADASRLELLDRLRTQNGQTLGELCAHLDMTRQAVTKHLRVLEGAGVVRAVRVGRESRFALDPRPIDDAWTYLEHVSRQWDDALARLKALVEEHD